jgi:hypothetical protein
MRMRFPVATALLAVCAHVPRVSAQVKASEGNNRPVTSTQRKPPPAPRNPPRFANPKPDPVEELRRFQSLPPEQREKELTKLPPARREHVEQQLERFDKLPPEQRERQFRQLELMNKLTPERKEVVRDEIQRLAALPPRQRRQQIYNDEFKQKFSPDEQELIHNRFPKM